MRDDAYTYSPCGNFRAWLDTDAFADDPRNWDPMGTMVCFHGKYNLGDSHDFRDRDYNSWDEIRGAIEEAGGVLILPLGLYDHSGITMYIGDSHDRWDGGQVGFIYCTEEDLKREGITLETAESILRDEVKHYDAYLTGNIYHWGVEQKVPACSCGETEDWESVETNGGYYDRADAERDMKSCLANFGEEVKV